MKLFKIILVCLGLLIAGVVVSDYIGLFDRFGVYRNKVSINIQSCDNEDLSLEDFEFKLVAHRDTLTLKNNKEFQDLYGKDHFLINYKDTTIECRFNNFKILSWRKTKLEVKVYCENQHTFLEWKMSSKNLESSKLICIENGSGSPSKIK